MDLVSPLGLLPLPRADRTSEAFEESEEHDVVYQQSVVAVFVLYYTTVELVRSVCLRGKP